MHKLKAEFQSVGRTHPGSVRAYNEDALLERADLGLWAVSDGMGGHAAGDVASALIVERMQAVGIRPGENFIASVRTALSEANAELYRRGAALSAKTTMGATVVVLGAFDMRFFCLWAGDSRLYRFRKGKLSRITRDHRYIQDLLDSGILQESEAEHHPRRSVITRAVGIDAELKLDLSEGVCKDDELAEILGSTSLDDAADKIVALCLERGAPDNLSLILVRSAAR